MKNWLFILLIALAIGAAVALRPPSPSAPPTTMPPISAPSAAPAVPSTPPPPNLETTPSPKPSAPEPTASTQQLCSKPSTHLIAERNELSFLFSKNDVAIFKGKPDPCFQAGSQIEIWARSLEEPEFMQIRARAEVLSPQPGERARLKILERRGALDAPLAATCEGFCDGVVTSGLFPKDAIWLDLRPQYQIDYWKPDGAQSVAFRPNTRASEVLKKIGTVKGKAFVISGVGHHWQNRSLLKFAKELRAAGAQSVHWYRGGLLEFRGVPMAPPTPVGAQIISAAEIPALLAKGAILTFVAPHAMRSMAVQGSRVIAPVTAAPYPIQPVSDQFYAQKSRRAEFKSNWMPSPTEEVIVYGFSEFDFRVYFFVRMLLDSGHKKVNWLRGGLPEIELARKLGAISY